MSEDWNDRARRGQQPPRDPNAGEPMTASTAGAARRGLRILSLDELQSIPATEYLVEGLIPEGSLALLYGASGVGKSFLGLDLAACIATGIPWQGRATRAGSTVYLAAEGSGGLPRRIAAWCGGEINDEDAVLRSHFRVLLVPVDLFDAEAVDELILALREIAGLRFVVVDTLARCMSGEENSATDMGKVIRACDRIREATGAAILLIHHSGKDEQRGERGSSALSGAVDCKMRLVRAEQGELRLICQKLKEDEQPADIWLALERVELLGDQAGASSLRIVSSRNPEANTSMDMSADMSASNVEHMVSVLAQVFGATGATTGELEEACGIRRTKFHEALQEAREAGRIRSEKQGRTQRNFVVQDLGEHVQEPGDELARAEGHHDVSNMSAPLGVTSPRTLRGGLDQDDEAESVDAELPWHVLVDDPARAEVGDMYNVFAPLEGASPRTRSGGEEHDEIARWENEGGAAA